MLVIACQPPHGAIEPAPLTSLPLPDLSSASGDVTAFWAADDQYYVRADDPSGATRWFRIESGASSDLASDAARAAADAHPVIGHVGPSGGTVAFPTGSSGRTVFRVWRGARGTEQPGRTRILAVRAARSRRMPA